jgi:glycosyl transferase family 25
MLTHLINLDRSRDRLAEFMANNGDLKNVYRFSAIDGNAVNVADLARTGVIREEILARYSPSDLGCALSHIALWEKTIAGGEPLTICEDDAIFNAHFDALSTRTIESLPSDWDIILWGWNFGSALLFELLPGVSPCLSVFDEDEMRRGTAEFRGQSFPVQPFRLRQAFGTICYSISPKGALALRELCLPLRDSSVYCVALGGNMPTSAIDIVMIEQYPKLKAFVGFPPLVLTKNEREKSSTRGLNSNVQWDEPAATDPEIQQLQRAVESVHGGRARLAESRTVSERLDDGTVWEGVVHLFDLHGHPEPMRAYAWSLPLEGQENLQFFSVLHGPPITSPADAVRAAIAADRKT